jgi:hypothetical protein
MNQFQVIVLATPIFFVLIGLVFAWGHISRTQTNSSAQGRTIPAEVMTAWCE